MKSDFTLTVHEDHDWLKNEIESKNKFLINTWRSAKTIIRVNKKDNELLSNFNKNVISIPNGYNHRKFKKLDRDDCLIKLNVDASNKILLNIGFYNEQKNQKLLIESISLLKKEIKKNLICYIIGGGPLHKELEDLVVQRGLEQVVFIVGQVEHDKLPLYLNIADIFCLSSNSEGNPTVLFEALGIGVPFIGTNVGGVPEIIISEKYGLLCNPREKDELIHVIERGLEKCWNRDEIREYAKQFTWENIFLKTKTYY